MAAPIVNMPDQLSADVCLIEATVVTGFETMAQDELQEKFGIGSTSTRGSINFEFPIDRAKSVSER